MTDTPSYWRVHNRLRLERGRASEHTCECGAPARDWAFQHTGAALRDPATGRWYSEDPDDYAPMCRSCHRTLDISHDPAYADFLRSHAASLGRRKKDPEHLSRAGKNRAAAYWDRYSRDADLRERHAAGARANGVAAREALAKKHLEDPELRKRQTAAMHKARARCLECGMVSVPGSIGMHQKHTNHEGVEKA